MAEFFGFEIKRKDSDIVTQETRQKSFTAETFDDGAVVVSAGGVYGTYVDLEGSARTEAELVTRYRMMSQHAEVERAVDDIINEAIVSDPEEEIVKLNLNELKQPESIKKLISNEFETILKLFNFKNQSYEIFKRWYVDGRLYYHAIIDEKSPREGIKELRYIDPRKIRKVREIKKKRDPETSTTVLSTRREYYVYNERGFNNSTPNAVSYYQASQGVRIAKDSIIHSTSGLMDVNNTVVQSYLHKAMRALNQLRTLEDATIIYKVSRAPERRIFYIDVGNLPKMKAEQYLRDMMAKYKNKVVYDSATGEIRDDRKFMTMLEDYWLPRREGNRGTQIDTLPGGQLVGDMSEVEYFKQVLYDALKVPTSRLSTENAFNIGRSTEITRDEVKFARFISRLRARFSHLFLKTMERQLVLKGIVTTEDWKEFSQDIKFDFAKDNFFSELKDLDIIKERMAVLKDVVEFAGKYYSHNWVRRNILRQSDEDVKTLDSEMSEEMNDIRYQPPEPESAMGQELPPQETQ